MFRRDKFIVPIGHFRWSTPDLHQSRALTLADPHMSSTWYKKEPITQFVAFISYMLYRHT